MNPQINTAGWETTTERFSQGSKQLKLTYTKDAKYPSSSDAESQGVAAADHKAL